MTSVQTGQEATVPRPGQQLRIRLVGGQVVEGRLMRADTRTVRLQATGRNGLMVLYRQAVAAMEAA